MSTVEEIHAALPRLSRVELEELRACLDDLLEDQLELSEHAKAQVAQSRREIAQGHFSTRQPD